MAGTGRSSDAQVEALIAVRQLALRTDGAELCNRKARAEVMWN